MIKDNSRDITSLTSNKNKPSDEPPEDNFNGADNENNSNEQHSIGEKPFDVDTKIVKNNFSEDKEDDCKTSDVGINLNDKADIDDDVNVKNESCSIDDESADDSDDSYGKKSDDINENSADFDDFFGIDKKAADDNSTDEDSYGAKLTR